MFFCIVNKINKIKPNIILKKFNDTQLFMQKSHIKYTSDHFLLISDTTDGFKTNDIIIEGTINIYNKTEIGLDLSSDYEVIKMLYEKNGPEFIKQINGDFSFIIYNFKQNELLVYRDHIGTHPLYYTRQDGYTSISSFLPLLLCQAKDVKINISWVKVQLINSVSAKNETTWKNLFRFVPAHYYQLNGQEFFCTQYWDLNLKDQVAKTADHTTIFKEKLSKAILGRNLPGKTGCELSAGLDSSIITATLLNNSEIPLNSFTHALPHEAYDKFKPFKDETELIEKLKEKYPHLSTNYISNPSGSIIQHIQDYIKYAKEMPQQQIQIMSDDIYRQAEKHNIKVLFSGFGGDDAISSYGYYYWLELIFKNKFGQLLKAIYLRKYNKLGFIRFLLKKTMDIKLYQLKFYRNITRIYHKKIFLKGFILEEYKYLQKKRIIEPNRKNYYLEKLKESISISNITSRMENSNIAGQRYGIRIVYPMTDKELLEYYFRLPPETQNTSQWPRRLIREAIKGWVPDEIRLRRDKSIATVPNSTYRIFKDQEEIRNYLKKYNRNSYIASLIDLDGLIAYFEELLIKNQIKNAKVYNRTLINYLTVLIFFELYESGELL